YVCSSDLPHPELHSNWNSHPRPLRGSVPSLSVPDTGSKGRISWSFQRRLYLPQQLHVPYSRAPPKLLFFSKFLFCQTGKTPHLCLFLFGRQPLLTADLHDTVCQIHHENLSFYHGLLSHDISQDQFPAIH